MSLGFLPRFFKRRDLRLKFFIKLARLFKFIELVKAPDTFVTYKDLRHSTIASLFKKLLSKVRVMLNINFLIRNILMIEEGFSSMTKRTPVLRVHLNRFHVLSLKEAFFFEKLFEIAGLSHGHDDIASADELPFDIKLRKGGPLRIDFHAHADISVR